eukprot:2130069-Pyramimonas_sp.AAC.1
MPRNLLAGRVPFHVVTSRGSGAIAALPEWRRAVARTAARRRHGALEPAAGCAWREDVAAGEPFCHAPARSPSHAL